MTNRELGLAYADSTLSINNKHQTGKQIFLLEGLGCANCAAKIETEVNNLQGVKMASVDFISRRLAVETEASIPIPGVIKKIEGIVKRIEPDVRVIVAGSDYLTPAHHQHEDINLKKQIVQLVLGGLLFAAGIIFNFSDGVELVIFLLSYLIVGGSVVIRALQGITRGEVFSEHFLMSVATIGAFLIGEYPEGVAVMLFYLVGEMFQDRAVDNSRRSISSLMDIRPDYANLKIGDQIKKVSPQDVSIGDVIVIKPGEKVPLDGRVLTGNSMVDTSALTGESMPRQLEAGKEALSGFININGVLTVQVTKSYGESTVAKILDMVQNASSRKAPTENFITKFARYYTPAVVFAALALAIIPPLVIPGAAFSDWTYRALVFLVVSCPCALVISIPLGFFGGIGGASKRGILVKGGNYLEALNYVETVVFDKTGTLTKGIFKVVDVNPSPGYTEQKLLEYAAYAESYSNHPIAVSIVKAYPAEIDKTLIENYEEIAGRGIRIRLQEQDILVGNAQLMTDQNISYQPVDTIGTIVHVAVDSQYAGHIIIADQVKEDAASAVAELKALGVKRTVMLTGDLALVGDRIGTQLGLDQIYAELLPADKVDRLEMLEREKSRKGKLLYVGDGINDAPVLARADIGVAMGGLGSDAAIEAADIVIMDDAPSQIATAIKIAKKTRRIVYQNIILALGIKMIFLALGALGMATMWEAVFADTGVALLAVFNAMRVINTTNLGQS